MDMMRMSIGCNAIMHGILWLTWQVSHHPPVSALYATSGSKKLQLLWWHHAVPRFCGNVTTLSATFCCGSSLVNWFTDKPFVFTWLLSFLLISATNKMKE
jgi:hypothetical protein